MGFLGKIAGAAGAWLKSYGKCLPSRSVADVFRAGQVLPELAYYYIGSETAPRAIIALERHLVLKTRFWKPLDVDGEGLRARVERMPEDPLGGSSFEGWQLIHPNGEVMGMACSPRRTVVQVKKDGSVVVHLPESGREAR